MDGNTVIKDPVFKTTRWTLVLRAKGQALPEALAALGQLCRVYWYPLYAYARSKGHGADDAQDLTQEFFARVVEKNYLDIADQKKGKFRWFLLTAFKCFLANEYDRQTAEKRGGGRVPISLDVGQAEKRFQLEPVVQAPSDKVFDRRWAMTVLRTAQDQLRAVYTAEDKLERFDKLDGHLPGKTPPKSYADTGAELGISEAAVKMEVRRMRKRFGELLKAEIAHTVASEAEIEEEIRYLIEVVST
jgi:DNA-directed RNA polymerase specialized sigma24 family protein